MSFEMTERIVAISPEEVGPMFSQLLGQYGEELPDGTRKINTIGAHWDNTDKTRIRAASLMDGTIQGVPLSDGRLAFKCLWQSALAAAFDSGDILGVEELDETELATLLAQQKDPQA